MNGTVLLFADVHLFLLEWGAWRDLLYSPKEGWSVSVD